MPRGKQIVKVIEIEECSLETAAEEFYKHNKVKGLANATQTAYKDYIGCFVRWCGKDTLLSDITPKMLDEYMISKQEKGTKTVSIASAMCHIRTFVKFCKTRGYIDNLEVTIPKFQAELKEPYTNEEMLKLLARPQTKNWVEWRNWAMINYFFSTGQRLSTVLHIKLEHLDLENGRVKLEWNKDKIQKYMPLSSALVKVLREYIELSKLEAGDYLFPEYEGKQLMVRSAESSITEYNNSRGVEKTSIHLFRHTFAKNYIMNGGNPMKLQKLLNHKTLDMTMKYVNLYGQDISNDLDIFNPLDNLKRTNYTPTKRTKVG